MKEKYSNKFDQKNSKS